MFKRLFVFGVILGALLLVPACPQPTPPVKQAVAHVVQCTGRAFSDQAIGLIPAVNACLVSLATLNPTPCLLALISPAKNIAEDDLACLVRSRGADFAAAAQANPGDTLSTRAADRATQFLADRRIMFSD